MLRSLLDHLTPLGDVVDKLTQAIDVDARADERGALHQKAAITRNWISCGEASRNGHQWIADLEAKERELTGIKNLKIQYNRVFGYYIEVTKSNYEQVPYRYTRKQTLANCERYMTPGCMKFRETVLGAQEKSNPFGAGAVYRKSATSCRSNSPDSAYGGRPENAGCAGLSWRLRRSKPLCPLEKLPMTA